MGQKIILGIKSLNDILDTVCLHRILLVCDSSFRFLPEQVRFILQKQMPVVFSGFTSNPLYEDVKIGVQQFRDAACDAIVAIGGGSTIDVAKCIKLYCRMSPDVNYLQQEYQDTGVPLIAIPTTAGTGSESTRYAVIYYDGKKQSVTHDSIIPDYAILEPLVLRTLPLEQKKYTMLDALCQGIESWWSVNSTDQSKEYSEKAIRLIVQYKTLYLYDTSDQAAEQIMLAANYAGRAINLAQTTAAHAMSYKLTSFYHLAHGHAVAICLPFVWDYMMDPSSGCVDTRGRAYLESVFSDISHALGYSTAENGIEGFSHLLQELRISSPRTTNADDLTVLANSVAPVRLKNNPVSLDEAVLYSLYQKIVSVGEA